MNLKTLKLAEASFLDRYPGGFKNPEIECIAKKHSLDKMSLLAQDLFKEDHFDDPKTIAEHMVKVIGRSSMVSVFEKAKFRDFARGLGSYESEVLAQGLREQLYGNEQNGFELVLSILRMEKLGKWPLMTIIPLYFKPTVNVFVKPTTVKNMIAFLKLPLTYNPTPTWEFYAAYRTIFNDMKQKVSPLLSPNNGAFSGFFMMTMTEE